MDYRKQYEHWLTSEYLTEEDRQVLSAMSDDEVYEAFYRNAEFGTAGMRGKMGMGTSRLNRYTIRMAAKGLAQLATEDFAKPSVVIAYDTRNNSRLFAEESARVLAASGVRTYMFDMVSPVPLLSFAVRHLSCSAGIVITASHNTKEYNGFKVYDETGCQMRPQAAARIADAMEAMSDPLAVVAAEGDIREIENIEIIGQSVAEAFLEAVGRCNGCDREEGTELKIVYTPIHGSGRDFVMKALENAGFKDVTLVWEQSMFDGDFPTVAKPNPEDAGALKLAADMALADRADLVVGTDPDCDRIGVGVRVRKDGKPGLPGDAESEIRFLSGNQTGALLVNYLSQKVRQRGQSPLSQKTMIMSLVTSQFGQVIAESNGLNVIKTHTGFKFIGAVMNEMEAEGREGEFLMGYEESYGYLVGTHARDKDGVSAAVAICRMAEHFRREGKTLADVLEELYEKHGRWSDRQENYVYEGADGEQTMKNIMAGLREKGAELLPGTGVKYTDYLTGADGYEPANMLKYDYPDGSWIIVRPSGTEPKIKVYYCSPGELPSIGEKMA